MPAQKANSSFMLILAIALTASVVSEAAPVHLDRKGEKWASATLRKMTMEEKVGQMILPWARVEFTNVNSPDYLRFKDEMRKYHVGGFGVTVFTDGAELLKSEPLEAAALTNQLQRDSKYPLLFAADFERGLSMRLKGATEFPPAMAFGAAGDKQLVRESGRITAEEARAVGIQWNWFPVADVNSNPANPIINTRSFGEDPQRVGELVAAYIDGARGAGMLTTVKHFPGHGDTDTDSHLTLARVNAGTDRLNAVELVPFRAAISAGVDAVMLAHITVPALEPDPDRPASISSRVITGLLKEQLGFRGLVVTDALDMGALTRVFTGTAAQISAAEAVEAIKAGNDMVIIPADLEGAYNGLLQAVAQGVLSEQRINESVLKILRIKASVGLDRNRLVNLDAVSTLVGKPENVAIGRQAADKALTLVEDQNHLLPLHASVQQDLPPNQSVSPPARVVAIIFTDDQRLSEGGRTFAHVLRQRSPGAAVYFVDAQNSGFIAPQILNAVKTADTVIAVAEAVPAARRVTRGQSSGSIGLDQSAAEILTATLQLAGDKTIVVAFGNPYIGSGVNGIKTYLCTFSNTSASAESLVNALYADMPVPGRLPVSLPGMAARGDGLDKPGNK